MIYQNQNTHIQCVCTPDEATEHLQKHLDEINKQKWKLKINPEKTKAITFTRKRQEITEHVTINKQIKYHGQTQQNIWK